MFHHFHDGRHPVGQGSISSGEFVGVLEHVGRDRILPAREWLGRALSGSLNPGDLCLTLDDNLRCQYDVALPVMRELGLTAMWFVSTAVMSGESEHLELYRAFRTRHFADVEEFYSVWFEHLGQSRFAADVTRALADFDPASHLAEFPFYTDGDRRFRFVRDDVLGPRRYAEMMDELMEVRDVDRGELARDLWMTESQVRELHEEGHVIGLHSHTHPTRLAELPIVDQRREYRDNCTQLMSITGERPVVVAHPCNSYNADTLEVLREIAVRIGFRSNPSLENHSDLEFPRQDHANILREMPVRG